MRIEYHRTLLADHVRNQAFHDALKAVIKPGKSIVADIGCGTGFLGFLAAKLGAKRVFLLETAEIVGVAKKLKAHNKLRNIEIVPAHSTEVTPPEQVDIVVSETLGNYALEENIIEIMNDAAARYLKPGGVLIPNGIAQFVAPVSSHRFHSELDAWRRVGFGLDFEPARTMSFNNIYVRTVGEADLFSQSAVAGPVAVQWDDVDLAARPKSSRRGEAKWIMAGPVTCYGLAVWWHCTLAADINVSTAPSAPRTHWEQLYLPLPDPIELRAGETLGAALRSKSAFGDGTNIAWTITASDARGRQLTQQAMNLEKGFIP